VQMRSDRRSVFLVGKGVTKMASGRLEVSLSLADKRASESQLGSVLLLACAGNWKVLLGQTGGTAGIQMEQRTCQRAFADGCHNEPAGNIMAFSDNT